MIFIEAHRERFGVEPVCEVLGASVATYYARKKRPPSERALRDRELLAEIREVHEENLSVYGSYRVWKALLRKGVVVARCTVERLMREHGIVGKSPRRRKRTTIADESAPRPADLVERRFKASRPNQLWVCDLTYVKTWEGFVYLAFVKDVFSRMIVGWQLADHLRTDLVLDALEMATWRRRPEPGSGLIHHSDRGSQYTSFRYTQRLSDLGIAASVGTVADAYDNAMAESWVGTFKTERVDDRPTFRSRFEAELAIVAYIGWFNDVRLHREIGDIPPAELEMAYGQSLPQIKEGIQ